MQALLLPERSNCRDSGVPSAKDAPEARFRELTAVGVVFEKPESRASLRGGVPHRSARDRSDPRAANSLCAVKCGTCAGARPPTAGRGACARPDSPRRHDHFGYPVVIVTRGGIVDAQLHSSLKPRAELPKRRYGFTRPPRCSVI